MSRSKPQTRPLTGLAIAALLLAMAACSREPAPVVALPPALDTRVAVNDEAANESDSLPPQVADSIPLNDGMSAAAGLPQPLAEPLVDDLRIDFEYGTLFEFTPDPITTERQVSIEPIGTPVLAALDSLATSLKRAGFEPFPEQDGSEPLHRLFRKAREPRDFEIELLALSYAEPELAAHPGGTGSVAMHLRPSKVDH